MLGKSIAMAAMAAMTIGAIPARVSADGSGFHDRWGQTRPGPGIIGVTFYVPYYDPYYSSYTGFDIRDLERYYDRSRYLDSCFVDRGTWTPFGLSVTQINTCYH
jgi:hypothetical protein